MNAVDGSFWGLEWEPIPADVGHATQKRVVRSSDGGLTWTVVSGGFRDERRLAHDADHRTVYSVMNGGIFRTNDNGVTWGPADNGLRALRVDRSQGVKFAPSNGSVLWATFSEGLLRSLDGGATFEKIYAGPESPMGEAIAFHPSDPATILTSAYPTKINSRSNFLDTGLIRSSDNGASWARTPNPGTRFLEDWLLEVWGIAYDPWDQSVVYIVGPESRAVAGGPGIYRSVDGGATIQSSASGFPEWGFPWAPFLTAVPTHPTSLFFGNTYSLAARTGLWRSTDAAATWTLVSEGIPPDVAPRCLLVHPRVPTILFACGDVTSQGSVPLFKSTDSGLTWSPLGSGLDSPPLTGAIHPTEPLKIYLGSSSGLFSSHDGGETWKAFTRGLPSGAAVWSIAIDPSNPSHLVLGTKSGLYEALLSDTDADLDGIESSIEDGAADGGDGNGDTVPDSEQANVASLRSADGNQVTVAVCPGTTPNECDAAGPVLAGVRALPPPIPTPSGQAMPVGAIAFSIQGLTRGQCSTVFFSLPSGTVVGGFFSYGATPELQTPHWYAFDYDGKTGAEIFNDAGRTRILAHVCDGMRGDGNVVADGVITVFGAPATVGRPAPAASGNQAFPARVARSRRPPTLRGAASTQSR